MIFLLLNVKVSKMNIIKLILFGVFFIFNFHFLSIILDTNTNQIYLSKIFIHPLYNKIGGSWFVLMGTSKPSKICHQLNFTQNIIEENYVENNNIQFHYHQINFINDKTFSISNNIYEIIYYCPIQNLLIIKNKFKNEILVLSQQIYLEDWEYIYIKVACLIYNSNCDNTYLYIHKENCFT